MYIVFILQYQKVQNNCQLLLVLKITQLQDKITV
jgi:hypothetical protein